MSIVGLHARAISTHPRNTIAAKLTAQNKIEKPCPALTDCWGLQQYELEFTLVIFILNRKSSLAGTVKANIAL